MGKHFIDQKGVKFCLFLLGNCMYVGLEARGHLMAHQHHGYV
jgi:hypothetical protein